MRLRHRATNSIGAMGFPTRSLFSHGGRQINFFRMGDHGMVKLFFSDRKFFSLLPVAMAEHRWLGWTRSNSGGGIETLQNRLRAAAAEAIPLPFALKLFEGKVDARMRPGRWMYAVMATNTQELVDKTYNKWAQTLLGLLPWKSSRAACWELG